MLYICAVQWSHYTTSICNCINFCTVHEAPYKEAPPDRIGASTYVRTYAQTYTWSDNHWQLCCVWWNRRTTKGPHMMKSPSELVVPDSLHLKWPGMRKKMHEPNCRLLRSGTEYIIALGSPTSPLLAEGSVSSSGESEPSTYNIATLYCRAHYSNIATCNLTKAYMQSQYTCPPIGPF